MSDCDTCSNCVWDEELEEYVCLADIDEDDYGPFWQSDDEYAVVRHQAF